MSLFQNDEYQWRETFFVLFDESQRPTAEQMRQVLSVVNPNFQLGDIRSDEEGLFESLTLISSDDYAGMDITCVAGEEKLEPVGELIEELRSTVATDDEMARLKRIPACNARFDIYHFERIVHDAAEEEDFMDPGSLLAVLEELTQMCDGIGIDPQSGSLV